MVTHNAKTQSFHCDCCLEDVPIRRDVSSDPEALLMMAEMVEIDHAECDKYKDARMARLARRFRKEAKRQELLAARRRNLAYSGPFSA